MKYSLLAHRRYTYLSNAVYLTLPSKYICLIFSYFNVTMPKFTSQILLLFSKVLHILEKLLLKNFTGLKVVS